MNNRGFFYTWETVNIPLVFEPKGCLNDYKHIVVSIKQSGIIQIDKTEDELGIDTENDTITINLDQEETSKFKGGDEKTPKTADIQVNIYYNNKERDVSRRKSINVYDNLYKKVIDDA